MLITCPECHTQYTLDAAKVSPNGQNVRCTQCKNVWFFKPVASAASGEGEDDQAAMMPASGQEAVDDIMPPENLPASFSDVLAEENDGDDRPPGDMPSFVHADIHVEAPPPFIDNRPFGLSANGFAAVVAVLLFAVTASGLLLAKNMIVPRLPSMLTLYESIGAKVTAPGEGLRMSMLQARGEKGDDGKVSLNVSGKLENISDVPRDYPSLRISAQNEYGAELRHWDFHPEHAVLASGEAIPLKFNFDNLPAETVKVHVQAIRK